MLLDDPDNRYVMIDSTIVRTHQLGGLLQMRVQSEALGRSRGGLSTKIHMVCDERAGPCVSLSREARQRMHPSDTLA